MVFFNFIASLFNSDKPTSSSRWFAFMIMCVLCAGIGYFFLWCKIPSDHITVFKYCMAFVLLLMGIVKIADIMALRTGIKVTESENKTSTGKESTVEKTVTGVDETKTVPQ